MAVPGGLLIWLKSAAGVQGKTPPEMQAVEPPLIPKLLLYTVLSAQERQMAAIDDAKAHLTEVQSDVQTLLAKPAGGVPEADVQAIADALATLDAQVKAALGA